MSVILIGENMHKKHSGSESILSLGQNPFPPRSAVQVRDFAGYMPVCFDRGRKIIFWSCCRCRVVVFDSYKAATFVKRKKEKRPELPFVRMLKSSALHKIVVGTFLVLFYFFWVLFCILASLISFLQYIQVGLTVDKSVKIRELNSPNIVEGLPAALLSRVFVGQCIGNCRYIWMVFSSAISAKYTASPRPWSWAPLDCKSRSKTSNVCSAQCRSSSCFALGLATVCAPSIKWICCRRGRKWADQRRPKTYICDINEILVFEYVIKYWTNRAHTCAAAAIILILLMHTLIQYIYIHM